MISVQELCTILPELDALSESTKSRIASSSIALRYAKGAVLYHTGDSPSGLFIVLSGRVHVTREKNARTTLLHIENVGGVLGEIPVFGGGPFPATARAAVAT